MYTVYMHVNKTNSKRYIGITSQKPELRWKNGLGYKCQKRFYNAILHYGWDNFEHLILSNDLTKKEAEAEEERLIALYSSNDLRYGYNIENGGVIHKLTAAQKEHLRQINTGRKHTAETRRKMSESHIGASTVWLTGRKQSEETIAKRFANAHGENNPRARCVYQYDLQGNFITMFPCMEAAKEALNISKTAHISQCCTGKRGKAHGFMWSYELEEKRPYERLWKGGVIHG